MSQLTLQARTCWKALFFIPSFYGFVTWNAGLLAYGAHLIHWDEPHPLAITIFALVSGALFISLVLHFVPYVKWYQHKVALLSDKPKKSPPLYMLVVLHSLGFLGIAVYWRELANVLGSIELFAITLISDSSLVRQALIEMSSVGIQISYVGWIAVALSAVYVVRANWNWLIGTLTLIQILANLTFIDRTRPIWIVMVSVLCAMALDRGQLSKRPLMLFGGVSAFAISTFILVGTWIGKTGGEAGGFGATALDGMFFSLYLYMTSGFAYANEMLSHTILGSGAPERIAYPFFKFLSEFGITAVPPSQISPFFYVPYPTNVGTFLEPFLNDGGVPFALAGILIFTVGFDSLGLVCLRSRMVLPTFFWANLCFTSMMGFFTQKIGSTAFWLFLSLCFAALFFDWLWRLIQTFGLRLRETLKVPN
jgi:hypothetical protein